MNPFRLSSRVRPPPRTARVGPANISAAVRARADPSAGAEPREPADRPCAIALPWRVSARSASGVLEVEHCGDRPAHSVRFALAGAGVLGLSLPGTVLPGERVRVVVRGGVAGVSAAAPDALLVLRWFEPGGQEFLWPIALE